MRYTVGIAGRALKVRNALLQDGALEDLSSAARNRLLWYSCGPTVYDDAHLGHARAYVTFDIMRRAVSTFCSRPVSYALGVTDIDDKILLRARERSISARELAAEYERRFFEDMAALNVLPPSSILRVTEHVPEIVDFISRMVKNGSAYVTSKGDVYFSVKSAGHRYRQLDPSRGNPDEADGARSSGPSDAEKRDSRDFALWKRSRPASEPTLDADTQVSWDSPWGRGRPGWHVECSAMATEAFGPRVDLHTGGIDLRFPHHTNELATAESALCCGGPTSSERWSNTWLHAGHLHMAGRKMSKSVKNFVTVREFLESGGDADAFRVFCLLHHYASNVEYSPDRLTDAVALLSRIRRFVASGEGQLAAAFARSSSFRSSCQRALSLRASTELFRRETQEAILNDFQTASVLSSAASLMTTAYKSVDSSSGDSSGASRLAFIEAAVQVAEVLTNFGVPVRQAAVSMNEGLELASLLDLAVQFRHDVRSHSRANNVGDVLRACDKFRSKLKDIGKVEIADAADGTCSWTRVA